MYVIHELVQPETLEEAYSVLTARPDSTVLGGGAYLRLGSRQIGTAIDLSGLKLDFINELADGIAIGAMTTLRQIELHPVFQSYFNGVLSLAAGQIMGVQFRNIATAGGSVYGKYGFSDFITPLLALDAEVELFKGGRMTLEQFLDSPGSKDILTRILLKKSQTQAVYLNLRNSATDYSVLNVTAARDGEVWRIAVGARPQRAKIAAQASEVLSQGNLTLADIEQAADIAANELTFGSNRRGTAEYRRVLCRVLVKRAVEGVLQCE